jgi:HlyD family secretion protein
LSTPFGIANAPLQMVMNLATTKRFWPIVVSVLLVAGVSFYYLYLRHETAKARYVAAEVDRGPVVRSVTATGTVNPVITVQVGTYDSGPIIAIYADFNTPVKAGQIIAKIDPRPFQVKLDQATATLADAKAQLDKDQADMAYKKLTFERDSRLSEAEAISQETLDNAHITYNQVVAQIALDRANIQTNAELLIRASPTSSRGRGAYGSRIAGCSNPSSSLPASTTATTSKF